MSTQKTFTIQKSTDCVVRLRARGYWDQRELVHANENNPTKHFQMRAYDGLNITYQEGVGSASTLNFAATVLPFRWDYFNGLKNNLYCLMPQNTNYRNTIYFSDTYYTTMNAVMITEENQCTLNGSSSMWLYKKKIPATAKTIKMVFKSTMKTPTSSQILVIGENNSQAYVQSSKYYKGYFGSAVGGSTILEEGKTYWFGVFEDSAYIKGYLLEDAQEQYTLDTLPEFEQWKEEWSQNVTTTYTFKNKTFQFFNNGSQPWLGCIDLNNCKIWADDVPFWYYGIKDTIADNDHLFAGVFEANYQDDGQARVYHVFCKGTEAVTLSTNENLEGQTYLGTFAIPKHDVFDYHETSQEIYDHFDVLGNLEIDQETGKVSGFSSSKYIQLQNNFTPPPQTPWKIRVRFKWKSGSAYLFSCGRYTEGPYIAVQNNKLDCGISTNQSFIQSVVGQEALEDGANYRVEWVYDGQTTYTLRAEKEGSDWVEIGHVDTDKYVYGANLPQLGYSSSGSAFGGVLDLSTDTYIEVDGSRWWSPLITHYSGHWVKK